MRLVDHQGGGNWRVNLLLAGRGRLARYLREVVRDYKPRSLAGDVHVELRSDARIVVQCAQRQAKKASISIEFAQDRGAAYLAKAPSNSWRRFIELDGVLALDEFKVRRVHGCSGAKGAAMRFATHRAMTIQSAKQSAVDSILDAAA